MKTIDKKIANIIQSDGKISSAEIAEKLDISVSNANERVRKLTSSGIVKAWRGVLDPKLVGAKLCALVLIDVDYNDEDDTIAAMVEFPEIQEIHHISGARSYMIKIRVSDTDQLQRFLKTKLKSLTGIQRTESFIVLDTVKETSEVFIGGSDYQ